MPGDSGLTITVNVHGKKFPVVVGEGKQHVRWLALVAAKKYQKEVTRCQVKRGLTPVIRGIKGCVEASLFAVEEAGVSVRCDVDWPSDI